MAKIRECFVCEMLLAVSERQMLDVQPPDGPRTKAEACARCWLKVHGRKTLVVVKAGKEFRCSAGRAQGDLFARGSAAGGPRGGRRG